MSTLLTAAATAVVVASALTAWSLNQASVGNPELAVLEPAPAGQAGPQPPAVTGVVTAPPLRRVVRPSPRAGDSAQPPAANVLGAPAACPNCGVVETVVAVHEHGQEQPLGYLMNIRMDDGSVRSIQHRGALAAGSRVAVEGTKLRPVP